MTDEKLTCLLSTFCDDLNEVEILSSYGLEEDAELVNARCVFDSDTLTIPFIHFDDEDWLFTPKDWQTDKPISPEEIGAVDWRVNDTDTEGVALGGLPRLAPWTPTPVLDPSVTARQLIGRELREARISKGYSLRDMEGVTGIPNGEISRIENGRRNAGIDTVAKIAAALGLSLKVE